MFRVETFIPLFRCVKAIHRKSVKDKVILFLPFFLLLSLLLSWAGAVHKMVFSLLMTWQPCLGQLIS